MALALLALGHSDSSLQQTFFLKRPGSLYFQVCQPHAHPGCPRLPFPKTLNSHPTNLNVPGCLLCYQ